MSERARRHNDYYRYITDEVVPVRARRGRPRRRLGDRLQHGRVPRLELLLPPAGPVRRPDRDVAGCTSPLFVGDYTDDDVYFNSPLYYLPDLGDPWHLELYRRARIMFCVGQGAWEDDDRRRHARLQEVLLHQKGIPPRSTTGATTWSITGTGGRRCCATTSNASSPEARPRGSAGSQLPLLVAL